MGCEGTRGQQEKALLTKTDLVHMPEEIHSEGWNDQGGLQLPGLGLGEDLQEA